MSNIDIGIRKYEENSTLQYWLLVQAKPITELTEHSKRSLKVKFYTKPWCNFYLQFINALYWKVFIICLIYLDTTIFISYFWIRLWSQAFTVIFLMHLTCFFYWIDFIGAVIERIYEKKRNQEKSRKIIHFILDASSLLPLSSVYLLLAKKIDLATLWKLRTITLLRFYRIQDFFSNLGNAERNRWKALIILYSSYMTLVVIFYANYFLYRIENYSPITIKDWNATMENQIMTSLYFSVEMILNVAYGDIYPISNPEIIMNAFSMAFGFSMAMGLFNGILTTSYVNRGRRREYYRNEYEATIQVLKERKIDKKLFETIKEHMQTLWKSKKGFSGPPPLHILPLALQKEIYFDINFGFLNRSIIFSVQPRSFLRSVSLLMKNVTYLTGEVILEPLVISEAMICVASGVIEILSEENDESVLFSFTTGTILGETSLFLSVPNRCFIRASTYVEIQVLKRVHFSRLALTYPNIYRSMRADIYDRLQKAATYLKNEKNNSVLDSDFIEIFRRKETKKFLKKLRERNTENMPETSDFDSSEILGLYVLSENIPRVKTLPINLIRNRPWILRPNTTLTTFWNFFIAVVVMIVVTIHPVWTAFYRNLTPSMYVLLASTNIIYIVDLYFECTTAIERKDNFTYITSVKDIIITKLKTLGFYLDILSTYYLSVYAELVWPSNVDYARLLLSMNSLLKTWRLISFIKTQENDIKNNLLFYVTLKYTISFIILVIWGAALLYLEACPGETCLPDRWFGQLELKAVKNKDQDPCTTWPMTTSLYFATVIFFTVGFGDVVAREITDCLIVTIFMIMGITVMILCVSEISSAFKHLAINSTTYQEEIFAVERFMMEHEIPKDLQKKVQNYLQLQWDYDKGHSLRRNSMVEVLPTIQKRIILTALTRAFLTVPVFRKSNTDFVKLLARLSKVRILPPNEQVIEAGTFNREMYILENGFCEVSNEKEGSRKIIGPVFSFGFYEMIKGIQHQLSIQTLTHAKIISLDYISYLKAITKYPTAKTEIDEIIEKKYQDPEVLFRLTVKEQNDTSKERRIIFKSQKFFSSAFVNVYNYHKRIQTKYWEPFHAWGKLRFFQFLVLPIVVAPDSLFLKIWMSVRIVNALIIATVAPIQFCFRSHELTLTIFLTTLQMFAIADMYLMFHVAYYDEHGLLMFHPASTSTNYLKGTFILDLITAFPYFLVIDLNYEKNYLLPLNIFLEIPGLLMILQLYKFFQGCQYLEKNILRKTDAIQILKFIPLTIVMTTFITAVVILLECNQIQITGQSQLLGTNKLATEYRKSIENFCLPLKRNQTLKDSGSFKVFLTTMYWVSSTMSGCGFGDLNPHSESSMITAIAIIVLGMFFYTYKFANISSSMVNTNVLISKYRRRILWMSKFLKKKNVSTTLQKRIFLHYEHEWQRTEGERPQKIFTNVNATLREKIVASMYEATVHQVPVFENVEKIIIKIIEKNLDEIYFLAGETIVNYNDIQEYIYLIYRGQVDLFTKNGELKASMGKGGLFGNISNKQYSLSSEIIIAADNVDVLRLDCKIFFQILQVFPSASGLIANLTSTKRNYIEPIKETRDANISSIKLNLFHIHKIPRALTAHSLQYVKGKDALHLKNNIYKRHDKPLLAFLILPGSTLHEGIGIWIFAMAYLSVTLSLYSFAFQDTSLCILIISYVVDVMFVVEIFLQFNMSYFNKFGDCVISRKKIKKKYLNSKKIFYDISSNLPLDVVAIIFFYKYKTQLISTLRLNRIIRIHFLLKFYRQKQRSLMINKIILQSSWILIMVTLIIHCFACIWFMAVSPLGYLQEPTWVTQMNVTEKKKWELYIYSVYHIIIISTSSGLGQLSVYSEQEIGLNIIFMLVCRLCMVILASILGAAINAQSQNLFLYQEQITELKVIFKRQNISEYQIGKMWNYVKTLWSSECGKQMPKFINGAPYALKCELMNEMFGSHLSQSYIFSNTDSSFLRQLAIHLKRFVYFPGNYIVQQGDIDDTMYFIHKGEVSVLTIHPDLMETIHFILTEKDNFGIRQGLIRGKKHDFSFRAETNVEILSLTLTHWNSLLKYFPTDEKKIYEKLNTLPLENKLTV